MGEDKGPLRGRQFFDRPQHHVIDFSHPVEQFAREVGLAVRLRCEGEDKVSGGVVIDELDGASLRLELAHHLDSHGVLARARKAQDQEDCLPQNDFTCCGYPSACVDLSPELPDTASAGLVTDWPVATPSVINTAVAWPSGPPSRLARLHQRTGPRWP